MNKRVIIIAIGLALSVGNLTSASAEEGVLSWIKSFISQKEIEPMTDKTYNKECGSCHFPYQPGLLPEASWRNLMDSKALANHFGDSAELDNATRTHILDLMIAASADKSGWRRSKKLMASLGGDAAPKRITATAYIRGKHHELSEASIKSNDQIKSLSFCDKCHQKAAEGNFDEDTVRIPGRTH